MVLPSPKAHALVLVHGFLGFEHIEFLGKKQSYFYGIDQKLEERGVTLYTPKVSSMGTVPQRAELLAEFIRSLDCKKLVLLGHSMGGLDARYAVSRLGCGECVSGVVSVGTPHLGTPLADLGRTEVAKAMRWVIEKFNLSLDALDWLSEEKATSFETLMPMRAGCYYGSVVGKTSRKSLVWKPALLASFEFLTRMRGENDGMVHVESQAYGEVITRVEADHWAQAGWLSKGDSSDFYFEIMKALQRSQIEMGYSDPNEQEPIVIA